MTCFTLIQRYKLRDLLQGIQIILNPEQTFEKKFMQQEIENDRERVQRKVTAAIKIMKTTYHVW